MWATVDTHTPYFGFDDSASVQRVDSRFDPYDASPEKLHLRYEIQTKYFDY